jgi:hypothetical protein
MQHQKNTTAVLQFPASINLAAPIAAHRLHVPRDHWHMHRLASTLLCATTPCNLPLMGVLLQLLLAEQRMLTDIQVS